MKTTLSSIILLLTFLPSILGGRVEQYEIVASQQVMEDRVDPNVQSHAKLAPMLWFHKQFPDFEMPDLKHGKLIKKIKEFVAKKFKPEFIAEIKEEHDISVYIHALFDSVKARVEEKHPGFPFARFLIFEKHHLLLEIVVSLLYIIFLILLSILGLVIES
ncbi:hypothetical protein ABG067_007018 [Albugo candida]|uniref:Uncharacterized protein n=1 Tax=Albugo candida TaxID=65357 RepID=A0A024GM48_9STRA|nr:unnamed protein product [Albugo candida]|eukprot:CCI47925.1 unnamed protein product [Albugo candida]